MDVFLFAKTMNVWVIIIAIINSGQKKSLFVMLAVNARIMLLNRLNIHIPNIIPKYIINKSVSSILLMLFFFNLFNI